jgi:hypothetical protein
MMPGDDEIPSVSGRPVSASSVGGSGFQEVYPDPRERAALLYELVFRRLPEAAPDPARATVAEARSTLSALLEELVRKRRKLENPTARPFPSDLTVEEVRILGQRAHLYRLPHPEFLPGAYLMLVLPPGETRGPRCFFLERTASPWGRDIGRLAFLDWNGGGRVDAGIVIQPNRDAFLGGVEVALRSWTDRPRRQETGSEGTAAEVSPPRP